MEKQKIFWVILSVSVFIIVVLVVGVFLLRQKPPTVAAEPANAVHPFSDLGTGTFEYGRETQPGQPEVLNLVIGGEKPQQPAQGAPSGAPTAETISPLPVPAQPREVQPTPQPAAKPAPKAPAVRKPAPASVATAVPSLTYWIQTGSYRSQSRAEELAKGLSQKGLAGRVFSYRSGTDTFYRVRVGPYANQKEAEKFLAIVKQIQGLESSYISQVYRSGSAN